MSNVQNQAQFFGLDTKSLWRDLLIAWRGMAQWPIVAWLWPKFGVGLWLPTGVQRLSYGLKTALIHDEKRASAARFEAVALPESLLLRHTLRFPKLPPGDLSAALALEIHTLSPFPMAELVWTHEPALQEADDDRALHVHVVLTTRKLIGKHIEAIHPQLQSKTPEVWVPRASGGGFLLLPGFGEAQRQRQSAVGRWVSALLVLLGLGLIVAIAVTPSVQLYLRALEAQQAMAALQKKVNPLMVQRESLIRTTEQLASLTSLIGKPNPPLQTLNLISEALPDDTSLLSLQIQGDKVSISGQTGNAAALMKKLGGTPGLHDVKAPTPAIKPLGATRESFTIEFTLDSTQVKSTP